MKNRSLYSSLVPINRLNKIADEQADAYKSASPFPYLVQDGVFDDEQLSNIVQDIETLPEDIWHKFDTRFEDKFQLSHEAHIPDSAKALIHQLNSQEFLLFLERLTGINGLIPDPYLNGAGLHKINQGGKLGIHIDFNIHKQLRLKRRLNVLLYLNKDWDEKWGGHFELWDSQKKNCVYQISPIFNRLVIFDTSSKSFHGHPNPLACPPDRSRFSIALYYYTNEKSDKPHSTVFLDKMGRKQELTPKDSIAARILRRLKSTFYQ